MPIMEPNCLAGVFNMKLRVDCKTAQAPLSMYIYIFHFKHTCRPLLLKYKKSPFHPYHTLTQ